MAVRSVGCNVFANERFQNRNDLLLLMPGKLRDRIEKLLGASHRPGAASFGRFAAKQIVSGNVECICEGLDLFGAQGNRFSFPIGNDALSCADPAGEIGLRQPGLLAGGRDAFAQGGAFSCRRSSRWHVANIPGTLKNRRNCLHKYTNYR